MSHLFLLQITLSKVEQAFRESWNHFIKQVPGMVLAIFIVVAGMFISKLISRWAKKVVYRRTEDPLLTNFLGQAARLIVVIIVLMFAMRAAGLQTVATTMLTAAGAGAVILGFAFRDIGENFISGIILAFNRPFDMNDTIRIGDIFGKVKAMELRYTKVKTFDGKDVYIPNSDVLKKPLENFTEDGFIRWDFIVGIGYEDNVYAAEQLILKTVNNTPGVIEEENRETYMVVDELAASTVNLKIFFWVKTFEFRKEANKIRGDVIANVKIALEENGFNLPGDIQEIKLYSGQSSIPVSIENLHAKKD